MPFWIYRQQRVKFGEERIFGGLLMEPFQDKTVGPVELVTYARTRAEAQRRVKIYNRLYGPSGYSYWFQDTKIGVKVPKTEDFIPRLEEGGEDGSENSEGGA